MRSSLADLMRRFLRRGPQRVVLIIASVVVLLVVAVAAAVVLGGSDGDEAEATPSTTTTTTEPATTTTSSTTTTTTEPSTTTTTSRWTPQEQQVIDAYRSAMDAYEDAASPPQPSSDDPAIAEHFTGRELHDLTVSLEILESNGTAYRYPEDSVASRKIRAVAFARRDGVEVADVEICQVTDREEIVLETGESLPLIEGVRTVHATHTLQRVEGAWKVAAFEQHGREEGVQQCPLEE